MLPKIHHLSNLHSLSYQGNMDRQKTLLELV